MRASIIIPVHNRVELTEDCLWALGGELGPHDEIILVDDCSTDRTSALALRPEVRYLRLETRSGFARAVNHGARAARGELLILLNNDTVPQRGWLDALTGGVDDPTIGIVGARLVYPGTSLIQHAGMVFGGDGIPYHIYRYHEAEAPHVLRRRSFACVTGACLLIRSELFERLEGLDEGYLNGLEDIDLCLRAGELGFRCEYEPGAVALHYEGASEGRFDHTIANLNRFHERWASRLVRDDLEVLSQDGFPAGSLTAGDPWRFGEAGRVAPLTGPAPAGQAAPGAALATDRPGDKSLASRRTPPLVWSGPLYDHSARAAEGRELCLTLAASGVDVQVLTTQNIDPTWVRTVSPDRLEELRLLERRQLNAQPVVVHHSIYHQTLRYSSPPPRRLCARLGFATQEIPAPLVARASRWSEVWVPSRFHRRASVAGGLDPARVHVIPPGVDAERFHPGHAPLFIEGAHGFVFLAVMPWTRAHGWDVLLRAFFSEFTAGEDVTLVIYTYPAPSSVDGVLTIEGIGRLASELGADHSGADVVIIRDPVAHEAYPRLYTAADTFVCPSRGDAHGRALIEAMASGLPVIATGAGCYQDWLDADNAELIAGELAPAPDGGSWVEPSLTQLKTAMRRAVQHPGHGRERGQEGRRRVERHFTIERIAAQVMQRLVD